MGRVSLNSGGFSEGCLILEREYLLPLIWHHKITIKTPHSSKNHKIMEENIQIQEQSHDQTSIFPTNSVRYQIFNPFSCSCLNLSLFCENGYDFFITILLVLQLFTEKRRWFNIREAA